MKVVVVGARPGSLGEAICKDLEAVGYTAVPCGVSGEGPSFDVLSMNVDQMVNALLLMGPHHVICTVGMNEPWFPGVDLPSWYANHLVLNTIGPMKIAEAFDEYTNRSGVRQRYEYHHAVVISSNSARIPRTKSAAYCASKAALSMALRVKARELGKARRNLLVYGYEPGLMSGTPMTENVADTYEEGLREMAMHRMPGVGPKGISPSRVSQMVVRNLEGGNELNGCLIPVDAGEL